MAIFKLDDSDLTTVNHNGKLRKIYKKDSYNKFTPDILDLGDINVNSQQVQALCAIFDLEGFTNFCKQIDPHLAVPEFLNEFLTWIFAEVRNLTISEDLGEGYTAHNTLPFLSKYLGDGILFLWDTNGLSDTSIRNIVVTMYEVCLSYGKFFYPMIRKKIISPPKKLRCGIARGIVYSVGNGNDFVGPCINMASRLQKLNSLTFCFSRKGVDPSKMSEKVRKVFIVKKIGIRGVGEDELVCVDKNEFRKLSSAEKSNFLKV